MNNIETYRAAAAEQKRAAEIRYSKLVRREERIALAVSGSLLIIGVLTLWWML